MSIEIKQENDFWTVEVHEVFAFKTYDEMELFLIGMSQNKRDHAQLRQLKNELRTQTLNDQREELKDKIESVASKLKDVLDKTR